MLPLLPARGAVSLRRRRWRREQPLHSDVGVAVPHRVEDLALHAYADAIDEAQFVEGDDPLAARERRIVLPPGGRSALRARARRLGGNGGPQRMRWVDEGADAVAPALRLGKCTMGGLSMMGIDAGRRRRPRHPGGINRVQVHRLARRRRVRRRALQPSAAWQGVAAKAATQAVDTDGGDQEQECAERDQADADAEHEGGARARAALAAAAVGVASVRREVAAAIAGGRAAGRC
mmetsp:Transcript_14629/g.61046  ORF Transcript_14629/g.61046 Transcript_14629/m.61046 type:complete len:234 (-) Transcript_14629:1851-2552(-)